ncbi:MAG: sigma-70 family RNA polymerase sigma factor [Gemmataceae bacterium]
MSTGTLVGVVRRLRDAARPEPDAQTDGQLLTGFLRRRHEAAFAELVRRHGPMVLGVCRRLLSPADADDAFQVTFLVLLRKAAGLAHRTTVGDYLYGVAYHTALKARAATVKRRAKESRTICPETPASDPDLAEILDRELNRLPAKYRSALVLCELEGCSRRDAARMLKLPEGTLSSRLATGKKMLARRLARLGLPAVAGAALADSASALPAPLVQATADAAASFVAGSLPPHLSALTEGVLKAMLFAKLKSAAAVTLAVGAIAVTTMTLSPRPNRAEAQPPAPAPATPEPPRKSAPAPKSNAADRQAVLRRAVETARGVPTPTEEAVGQKARMLDVLARDQAKAGDADAAKTFQAAVDAALVLKQEHERWWMLKQIGVAQGDAGLLTDALATLERVRDPAERDAIRYFLVRSLAKQGKVADARKVLDSIKITSRDSTARDQALQALAEGQIKTGDFAGAAETLNSIREWSFRRHGFSDLAMAQAKSGDMAGARKIVDQMLKEMRAFREDDSGFMTWVNDVAYTQSAIGDSQAALEWVEQLKSPAVKAYGLHAVAQGMERGK